MNYIKKSFLILILVLFFPSISFATQGACSYHSGVNCSAGPSYSGKVQCNDGWINSSVYFVDAVECKVSNIKKIDFKLFEYYKIALSDSIKELDGYLSASLLVRNIVFNKDFKEILDMINSCFEKECFFEINNKITFLLNKINSYDYDGGFYKNLKEDREYLLGLYCSCEGKLRIMAFEPEIENVIKTKTNEFNNQTEEFKKRINVLIQELDSKKKENNILELKKENTENKIKPKELIKSENNLKKESKKITPKINKVSVVDNMVSITSSNLEVQKKVSFKKIPWYKKIFNWFK